MHKLKAHIVWFFCSLVFFTAKGQDTLTLQKAIAYTLENNHGIIVAKNNTEISKNNNAIWNADLLPPATVNGGVNGSVNASKLEFAGNTPPIEETGAKSVSYNASVGTNYSLFEGFGRIYNLKKLQTTEQLSEAQARLTIENTVMQVANAYYEIARIQHQKEIAEESLEISRQRYQRAQSKYDYGSASKVDVLSAEVDLNTDSVNFMNTILNLENAKRNLLFLLGDNKVENFGVEKQVTYREEMQYDQLKTNAISNSSSVLVAAYNLESSELDLKTVKSILYPRVSANASYGFSESRNDASFIEKSQSLGVSGGVSLTYNIRGLQAKTQIENAQIMIETNREKKEEAVRLVEKELENAYATYLHRLKVLGIEKESVKTAELNFKRTGEAYKLGQVTTTQFREAQLNLMRSRIRVNDAQYVAKLAELELLRLSGLLLEKRQGGE